MNCEEKWIIKTADLVVGSTLTFDLTDSQSVVLHKAGTPISERLLDRLQKKNIHSVSVQGQRKQVDTQSLLLSYFDRLTIEATNRLITKCEIATKSFLEQIQSGEKGNIKSLVANTSEFFTLAMENSSAVFAVLSTRASKSPPELSAKIAARSTWMSLMAVTIAVTMDCEPEDCISAGMAGLLHDSSFLAHPEWFSEGSGINGSAKALAEFRNHPMESLSMIRELQPELDDNLQASIEQVHEQFDGSGFPYGLSGDEITYSAQILNAVDAYIQLVQPIFGSPGFTPSDALAYMCRNAATKRFNPQIIRGLVVALSLYPIGSTVELDDGSLAIVVNSNSSNPLEPVVRLLSDENAIEDLTTSERSVTSPHVGNKTTAIRIAKSMMDAVLWRCDIADVSMD